MMPKMTDISIKQWNPSHVHLDQIGSYQLSEVLVIHAVYDMTQTVINGGIMGKNIRDIGRSSMVFMNGN